jgi:ABC-2 type transport system permease protein
MLVELIALWADNIWSLSVMTRFFCFFFGGSYIPVEFFPDWLQKVLIYTPFPYMITLPIRVIMGKTHSSEMILGLFFLSLWGLFFMAVTKLLWRKGQLRYTGVGI